MIYTLADGSEIDTASDCTFEERNFLQKMMIFHHMKMERRLFNARWQCEQSPVWRGPEALNHPSPAVRILLDMEKTL
jgi:hypothetical protein